MHRSLKIQRLIKKSLYSSHQDITRTETRANECTDKYLAIYYEQSFVILDAYRTQNTVLDLDRKL